MKQRLSLLVAVGALSGGLLAGCATNSGSATPTTLAPPLATSFTAGPADVVVLPMGHLATRLNTFWQVFRTGTSSPHWHLSTPGGVGDNGGFVAAAASTTDPPSDRRALVLGFLASNLLGFSPLTSSSNDGVSWQGGAVLPQALTPVPSSLVATPGGDYALVGKDGNEVLTSNRLASGWHLLLKRQALANSAAGRVCGVTAITAISPTTSGLLIGASCSHSGADPLFTYSSGHFRSVAGGTSGGAGTVLGVYMARSGPVVLVSSEKQGHNEVVALSESSTGSFSASKPLRLGTGQRLEWGGTDNGEIYLLTASGPKPTPGGERLEKLSTTGSAWQLTARPPVGTVAIGFSSSGQPEAFVVHDSHLGILLSQGGGDWKSLQSVDVPIQYGSAG